MVQLGKGIAVFDYDGTIIKFDTTKLIILFCLFLAPIKFILSATRIHKKDKNISISTYFLSATIVGKNIKDVESVFNIYSKICRIFINKEIINEINKIKKLEYLVLIASASPIFVVKSVLPKIEVLGHDYQIIKNRYTGKTNNKMPIKEEKLLQVIEIVKRKGFSSIEYAYSDSIIDSPLLNYANTSYLVKKGKIALWNKNDSQ